MYQAAHKSFESDGSLEKGLAIGMGLLGRAVALASGSAAGSGTPASSSPPPGLLLTVVGSAARLCGELLGW